MTFALSLLLASSAFASDPFARCANLESAALQLNCKIFVVDQMIEKYLDSEALVEVNAQVKKDCPARETRSRLHPKLILLTALDCEFRRKLEFYNNSI